jgi:hypothetical protein
MARAQAAMSAESEDTERNITMNMKNIATQAQIDSDLKALTAISDRHAPEDLLALVGQKTDEWEITAIEAGEQTRWVPDGFVAPADKLQWSIDRACGKKVTPPAILRTDWGFYARVMGNAVLVESWLHERSYHKASARSANTVWIGEICAGVMSLKAGDYHECDVCGYVTEN